MQPHLKLLITIVVIWVSTLFTGFTSAVVKITNRDIRNTYYFKKNYKNVQTSASTPTSTSTFNKLIIISKKGKKGKIKKPTFIYKLLKIKKCQDKQKYIEKKHEGIQIWATTNVFNLKKFKDLFPSETKQKEGEKEREKEGYLDLDKIKNLKDINEDLYTELKEYNEEKAREMERKKMQEKKDTKKDSKDQTLDEQEKFDTNTPLFKGLPILMIDGKDFEGFADTRKKTISPKIATEFSNEEYNEVVRGVQKDHEHMETTKTEIQIGTDTKNEKDKENEKEKEGNEPMTQFERDVRLLLKQKEQQEAQEAKTKKRLQKTIDNRIEKYKKVGKHYYMETYMGEILFDRNYPGYIYCNYGNNLKELETRNEKGNSEHPSYINPNNIHLRTGRKREEQKKRDSGIKQKKRWNMDNTENKDIKRGNWKYYDDTVKDLLDSTDQEKIKENYYSNNYYQRTNYNAGFGNLEKVQNCYFDPQFIGSAETYPANISVGMNFIWPINFIPLLCKQYTKRLGKPIKSELFNLGGFDSLQIWFYPDGMNNSVDGYCSIKLVMRPGSYLPVQIFFFAFSEYNYVHTAPFYKESAEYVTSSLNFCKLLLKTEENLKKVENNKDYIILGPAGNVYIGVGIYDDYYDFDKDFKQFYSLSDKYKKKDTITKEHTKKKFQYKYDWDEGVHIFDNWLKKQTAITDDKDELLPVSYTHSEWYENYKYRYVPEKNPFKFLNKKKDVNQWNRHPF